MSVKGGTGALNLMKRLASSSLYIRNSPDGLEEETLSCWASDARTNEERAYPGADAPYYNSELTKVLRSVKSYPSVKMYY